MSNSEFHLHQNLRRVLYTLALVSFISTVILFYLSVSSRENPIGAEVSMPKDDSVKNALRNGRVNSKQALFTLVNGSNFDWSGVRVTVNDMYVVEPGPILAGQSKDIRVGDLKNIDTIPSMLIPPNRSVAVRQSFDRNDDDTTQNLYYGLDALKRIKVRTNSGRITYDPVKKEYQRIGIDGEPTSFFKDLRNTL